MPTAMHWYNMAAQKWGAVDPTDENAVTNFFVSNLAKLPAKKREAVVKFLLGHDGPAKIPSDCTCSSCQKRRKHDGR